MGELAQARFGSIAGQGRLLCILASRVCVTTRSVDDKDAFPANDSLIGSLDMVED